ncbi:MAG: hypothetical protein ACFB2W_22840 [Leptolyngbyaceae cyanobacterium]
MWRHWQKVSNYIRSVQTYQDMSPDLSIRNQVNQSLRPQRRPLSIEDWCKEFYQDPHQQNIARVVYRSLEAHSGIEFNRVRPHDRLIEDLQFPLVCWFDWSTRFGDDILQQLGIDISDCFDETRIQTLADLVDFLDACLTDSSA